MNAGKTYSIPRLDWIYGLNQYPSKYSNQNHAWYQIIVIWSGKSHLYGYVINRIVPYGIFKWQCAHVAET